MDRKIATQAAQVRQMYATSNVTQTTSLTLAAILCYKLQDVIDHARVVEWFSLIATVTIFRTVLAFKYHRLVHFENKSTHFWLNGFRLGVLCSGVAWGTVSILLFPSSNVQYQFFIVAMLAGLSAGGLISYSADLPSGIVYATAVLTPLTIRMLLEDNGLSVAMGTSLLLYFCFMVMSMRYMSRHISENITMHLEATAREEAMRLSEQRYRLLLNHSPAGIFHYNKNFVITYCNDRMAEILHNSIDRIVGINLKDLNDHLILPALQKALDGGVGHYEGYYISTFSDYNLWIEMTSAPFFNIMGEVEGGNAIVQDITKRIEAEQAMHRESEKYHALLRNVSDGIHILDSHGNIMDASKSFCEMLGYKYSEMIGMNVIQWDAKFTEPELKIILRQQSEQQTPTNFGTRHRRKDGTIIDVEVSGYWLQLYDQKMMIYSSRDITERKHNEELLRKSAAEIEDLYNNAPCGYHSLDMDGVIQRINDTELKWLGYTRDEVVGKLKFTDLLTPASSHAFQMNFVSFKKHGVFRNIENEMVRNDGSILYGLVNATAQYNASNEYLSSHATVFDITERKKTEDTLRSLFAALEHSPIAVIISDSNANILYVSSMFTEITGYSSKEVAGQNLRILQAGHIDQKIYLKMWNDLTEGKSWRGELLNKSKQGREYWEDLQITPVKTTEGEVSNYVVVSEDISERKAVEETMRHLANYDPLTELPNRSLVDDRLQRALAAAKREKTNMALMYLDLDNFKPINDTLGHGVGDLLLKEVSGRMQNCVREADTVGRIGGDEFVVLLPKVDSDQDVTLVAEKIRHSLNQPFVIAGQDLLISSSIGVAIYPEHGIDEKTLVRNADTAMYFAKKGGRNTVRLFEPNMIKVEVSVPDIKN